VIYADILTSWFFDAVLEIYTQQFTRCLHFTQQYSIYIYLGYFVVVSSCHRGALSYSLCLMIKLTKETRQMGLKGKGLEREGMKRVFIVED